MANSDFKTLSVTDIVRMRERASSGVAADTTIAANSNRVPETTIGIDKPAEARVTAPTNTKPEIKKPTGETGDLYFKDTNIKEDIDMVVAGKQIKIPADQMNEFLLRTSHNNVGELTEADKRIVETMDLGVHAEARDDKESLQLGQNAIAGMINTSKQIITENSAPSKETVESTNNTAPDPEKYDYEDLTVSEEEVYPLYGKEDSSVFNENMYEDADTDEDVVVHQPDKNEEATESIEQYIARKNGKSVDVLDKDDTRIESFKAGNSGVAEIKVNKFEEGLNSIKIVPFNGKKLIKQRQNQLANSKKTPICALSSNIFCEVSGFSYSDLTQLNAERNDGYIDRRRQIEVLYKKILNPNVPLSFDTFLRATSIYDEEAFYFGAFKSTFGDKVKIPLTCQHEDCQHSFTYEIDVDDLIISKNYINMGDKVKDIMSMHNIKDLEESDVNKIRRFRLSSGHVIDICHPSLHTLLEKTIKLVANSPLATDEKYNDIIDLLPFISAIYVPVVPEGDTRLASEISPAELDYIEISIAENDKLKVARAKLTALCDEILTLGYNSVMEISKFIMDRVTSIQEQFSMGLVDVVCPKCGRPLGAKSNGHENFIPIKIRELIFLNQLRQINEVSTK